MIASAERRHVLEDQVAGLDHLQRLRGVDDVGRGQAEVQPAGGRPDDFGHRRRERNHVVLRGLFDLVDARDVERALVAQLARGFGRHDAGGGHRFGRRDFHLEPGLVPALLAPDATHLRVRVPRNQSASCSLVTCRPLTLPKHRHRQRPVGEEPIREPEHVLCRHLLDRRQHLVEAEGVIAIHLLPREVRHAARRALEAEHQRALQVILGAAQLDRIEPARLHLPDLGDHDVDQLRDGFVRAPGVDAERAGVLIRARDRRTPSTPGRASRARSGTAASSSSRRAWC